MTTEKQPILVWRFHEAPEELQIVSTNGGDEDWLAEIPPCFHGDLPSWMHSNAFGCCETNEYPHPSKDGWIIAVGCHA